MSRLYTYNARDQLTSVGGVSYAYDAEGNLISSTLGGGTTSYMVNPEAPLSQVLVRTIGGMQTYYVYGAGGQLLYEVTGVGGTESYKTYHYDNRGNTAFLVASDGLTITDHAEYSPYGTINYRTGATNTPFLFNGAYGVMTDPSNGLLSMRARFYNPYIQRFVNADPIGFGGGMNWYAFASGDPIDRMDPFGLSDGSDGTYTDFAVGVQVAGSDEMLGQLSGVNSMLGYSYPLASYLNGRALDAFTNLINRFNGWYVTATGADLRSQRGMIGRWTGKAEVFVAGFLLSGGEGEAAESGTDLALGSRFAGTRDFANAIGADHLLDPNPLWKDVFQAHVADPTTTFHVNMGGFFGDTPAEMIQNEINSESNTGWELQQLQNAGRLPQVNFYPAGQTTPIPNPIAP